MTTTTDIRLTQKQSQWKAPRRKGSGVDGRHSQRHSSGRSLWRDAPVHAAVCGCAHSVVGGGPQHVGREMNHEKNEHVKRVAVIAQHRNLTLICSSVIRCVQLWSCSHFCCYLPQIFLSKRPWSEAYWWQQCTAHTLHIVQLSAVLFLRFLKWM